MRNNWSNMRSSDPESLMSSLMQMAFWEEISETRNNVNNVISLKNTETSLPINKNVNHQTKNTKSQLGRILSH